MTAILLLAAAAAIPIRNPFWPVGYAGEREPISDTPRIALRPAHETATEEDTKTSINAETIAAAEASTVNAADRHWINARQSLKIGGTMRAGGGRQSVSINGRIYGDGDLVSVNLDGRRFTWRVRTLTSSGTLKLERVKCREIDKDPEANRGTDL